MILSNCLLHNKTLSLHNVIHDVILYHDYADIVTFNARVTNNTMYHVYMIIVTCMVMQRHIFIIAKGDCVTWPHHDCLDFMYMVFGLCHVYIIVSHCLDDCKHNITYCTSTKLCILRC